jgi:acid stress chaperone HdeB
MCLKPVISALILALIATSAEAQVQLDLSKVTCDQFVHHKVGSPRVMAAWFSGYYNGKRDNLIIDMKDFEASLNKVQNFCGVENNFSVTVLKAVERVIGIAK